MAVEGQCNCGKIKVILPTQPDSCVLCFCDNCRRSGGLSSVNYILKTSSVSIQDPIKALKSYPDNNTINGETILRHFCSTCGSPIFSLNPGKPDTSIVKASLFDNIPAPSNQIFTEKKPDWLGEIGH
ncbi:Mss4-like protein [Xylogone sp. PMI_703]|nr:Mss4-like protein [Xylogone sp. PMI_703]